MIDVEMIDMSRIDLEANTRLSLQQIEKAILATCSKVSEKKKRFKVETHYQILKSSI